MPAAQETNSPTPTAAPDPNAAVNLDSKIDITIKEGTTMGQFITWLRLKYPKPNFLCPPEIEKITLRQVKLHGVDFYSLGSIVIFASEGKISLQSGGDNNIIEFQQISSPEKQVGAFNIYDYLYNLAAYRKLSGATPQANTPEADLKALKDLVKQSLALAGYGGEEPSFSFYPDGNLFIVIGSQNAIDIAGKIIRAVDPATPQPAGAPQSTAPTP